MDSICIVEDQTSDPIRRAADVPLVVDMGVVTTGTRRTESPRRTACMSKPSSMRAKRLFWVGMVLILLGMALIVLATRDVLMHGLGGLSVLLGIVLAVRNSRL